MPLDARAIQLPVRIWGCWTVLEERFGGNHAVKGFPKFRAGLYLFQSITLLQEGTPGGRRHQKGHRSIQKTLQGAEGEEWAGCPTCRSLVQLLGVQCSSRPGV